MRNVTSLKILQIFKGELGHYEYLYANKFNNLGEIDKFLEKHKLSKLMKK